MKKLSKLFLITVLSFTLSGCSGLLPKLTFNRTTSALPQETKKAYHKDICKGETKLNDRGEIVYCQKGYYSKGQTYNQSERKFTIFERVGNWISNLKGFFGVAIIGSIILSFMGLGGLVVSAWSALFGTVAKGFRALVGGIQKGKKYVRTNGYKYNEKEREIYQQGADDMLKQISENIKDKKVKKKINKLRAEQE